MKQLLAICLKMEADKRGIFGCFRHRATFVADPVLEEVKSSIKATMSKREKNKRKLPWLFKSRPTKQTASLMPSFKEPNMSKMYKHMVKELEQLVHDIRIHERMLTMALAKYIPLEKNVIANSEKKMNELQNQSKVKTSGKDMENTTDTLSNHSDDEMEDETESSCEDDSEAETETSGEGETETETETNRAEQRVREYNRDNPDAPLTFNIKSQIMRVTHPPRHLLSMDTLDYLLYLRRRESGSRAHRAIDVDRLMYPANADYPISDYTKRYLDIKYYIPSLSALCQAAIKSLVCPLQMELKRDGNMYNLTMQQAELPCFLKHRSLSPLLPPPVKNQIISILQNKYNRNNNHPVNDEIDISISTPDLSITKSKYTSVKINDEVETITTDISCNTNNNHPVNGEVDQTETRPASTIMKSKYPSAKSSKSEKKHASKKSKTLQRAMVIRRERVYKATDRFYLAPVGSISVQGLPPSKHVTSWMDIASIIYQGTFNHKNLDGSRYPKQSMHTTIPPSMMTSVMIKMKIYSIRPIKGTMTNLKTLLQVNESSRIFKETHAKFVCVNLLLALKFLHSHELFHGSICPAKILFNDKGYPCLTGFSSTEIIEDRQGRPRVRPPLEYSTPEQLYFEYITEQTDIFSLGCVVYAMVYGRPPHMGPDKASTRRNIVNTNFVPAFAPEEMSAEGRKFIFKCLKKKEYRRFSLVDLKKSLVESVPWFAKLNEERLYRQSIPSPLLNVIGKL